jgi:hypothetical protein
VWQAREGRETVYTFATCTLAQWQINSADGLTHDIITLSNNASDYVFM